MDVRRLPGLSRLVNEKPPVRQGGDAPGAATDDSGYHSLYGHADHVAAACSIGVSDRLHVDWASQIPFHELLQRFFRQIARRAAMVSVSIRSPATVQLRCGILATGNEYGLWHRVHAHTSSTSVNVQSVTLMLSPLRLDRRRAAKLMNIAQPTRTKRGPPRDRQCRER